MYYGFVKTSVGLEELFSLVKKCEKTVMMFSMKIMLECM